MAGMPSVNVRVARTEYMGSPFTVKLYDHSTDYAAICEICKDVYGGSDYMPRMLPHLANDPHALLLVTSKTGHSVDGVVAADKRGSMVFVFGLRVRTSTRGQGVGDLLMAELVKQATERFQPQGAVCMATATILSNLASQRIICRNFQLAPQPLACLDFWPGGNYLGQYEQSFDWPAQQATHSILDHVPGARAALEDDSKAVALLPHWRPASSTQEVSTALRYIRAHRARPSGLRATIQPETVTVEVIDAPCVQAGGIGDEWLPGFYDIFPADSEWAAQRVAEKRVWVLQAADDSTYLGVTVLAHSVEGRRHTAGIVAWDSEVVHASLLLASSHEMHFVAFIDRGCSVPIGEASHSRTTAEECQPPPPAVYATTDGVHDAILFGRMFLAPSAVSIKEMKF